MAENDEESGGQKKKVVKEEIINVTEGAPAWMATFADLVTLLMCFFCSFICHEYHPAGDL